MIWHESMVELPRLASFDLYSCNVLAYCRKPSVILTKDFPKRPCTVSATLRPIAVLPVKETSLTLLSSDMLWPTSAPPWHSVEMAPGRPFFSRTSATILEKRTLFKHRQYLPKQVNTYTMTAYIFAYIKQE